MSWDFDSKEHAREKYGNFNTPILIKLTSKFNKVAQKAWQNRLATAEDGPGEPSTVFEPVDAQDSAELLCKALN